MKFLLVLHDVREFNLRHNFFDSTCNKCLLNLLLVLCKQVHDARTEHWLSPLDSSELSLIYLKIHRILFLLSYARCGSWCNSFSRCLRRCLITKLLRVQLSEEALLHSNIFQDSSLHWTRLSVTLLLLFPHQRVDLARFNLPATVKQEWVHIEIIFLLLRCGVLRLRWTLQGRKAEHSSFSWTFFKRSNDNLRQLLLELLVLEINLPRQYSAEFVVCLVRGDVAVLNEGWVHSNRVA